MKKVYLVYPEPQRRKSHRSGFAHILIIILIVIPIILLSAAAPWVTEEFAKQKVLSSIKPSCEEFKTPEVVVDYKTTFPGDVYRFSLKEYFDFGRQTKIVINCGLQTQTLTVNTYFVSFIGTVHKVSSQEYTPPQTNNQNVDSSYASQEECEAKTGKTCGFVMCDVVPQGKTFEETCRKGFKAGWRPKGQGLTPISDSGNPETVSLDAASNGNTITTKPGTIIDVKFDNDSDWTKPVSSDNLVVSTVDASAASDGSATGKFLVVKEGTATLIAEQACKKVRPSGFQCLGITSTWRVTIVSSNATNNETTNPDSIGANWKTFTLKSFNFTFLYPNEWTISQDKCSDINSSEVTLISNGGSIFRIKPMGCNGGIDFGGAKYDTFKKQIGDRSVGLTIYQENSSPSLGVGFITKAEKQENVFEIFFKGDQKVGDWNKIKQILSTLKFSQ